MSLTVFTGPMFSGKTTKLVESITNLVDSIQTSAMIINHSIDVRSTNVISTHSSTTKNISYKIKQIKTNKLCDVDVSGFDVIGIDECQFFGDLYEAVVKWLALGKRIYASGLDGNAKQELFGDTYRLLPIANDFYKLKSICTICRVPEKTASFTRRLETSENHESEIDVGGADKYIAVCRFHI